MKRLSALFCFILFCFNGKAQQIGNYVANGSFEEFYNCSSPYDMVVKNWASPDTICFLPIFFSTCNGSIPQGCCSVYQNPHSGGTYTYLHLYGNPTSNIRRMYAKNRMKSTLQAGKSYCVRFYVNIWNGSRLGIDGFAAYFGGSEIDTITKCYAPLTYIAPQIQNPHGNIITDTLNWVAITGTFTANGTEKYLLLGNFLSDTDTDTLTINTTYILAPVSAGNIDDVSCIEVNLPAYAGRDTTIYLGDSAYIGREPDFAIDTGCVWYQLPNTTTPIDTISGMWVKPNATGTYTYVVRQELECSAVKWDTVVVTVRDFDVGLQEYEKENWKVELYPNPATNAINIVSKDGNENEELNVTVQDLTGRIIYKARVKTKSFVADMDLNLLNGAYLVVIKNIKHESITKKLLIAK